MAAPTRTKVQREHDLAQIAELYLKGHTQAAIGEVLNLSQRVISRDLETIQKRWAEKSVIDLDAAKRIELARIDELEREYWAAWRRSLEQVTKTKTKRNHLGDEAIVMREETSGNPAFLAGVQNCIDQRCKLLGLYEAARISIDWRKAVEKQGIDTGDLLEHMVNAYIRTVNPGTN